MFRKRDTAGRAAAEGGRHRPGAAPAPAEPAPREPVPAPAPPEPVPAAEPPWAPPPPGLDVSTAHPARIWNYWLGGRDWFPADREAGDAIGRRSPEVPEVARAQRAFLVRAVRFLAGPAKVRQFLDVGAGLPSGGNTHEIVQRITPDSGIVYVDHDPAVALHAKALLAEAALAEDGPAEGVVSYLQADLRDVSAVLAGASATLDLTRPVALLMLGVLGHIEDLGAARSITSHLVDSLPSGSYLAVADGPVAEGPMAAGSMAEGSMAGGWAVEGWPAAGHDGGWLRGPDQLAGFFDALDLVEPGVVPCPQWRPDLRDGGRVPPAWCGVARKP